MESTIEQTDLFISGSIRERHEESASSEFNVNEGRRRDFQKPPTQLHKDPHRFTIQGGHPPFAACMDLEGLEAPELIPKQLTSMELAFFPNKR